MPIFRTMAAIIPVFAGPPSPSSLAPPFNSYNRDVSITRRTALAAGLGAAAGCGPKRGSGFDGHAFVANEESRTVTAVNLLSFRVARQIPLPAPPSAVIAHPAHPFVYVLTPRTGTVYEIDAGRLSVARKAQAGAGAISMRLSAGGEALWVACHDPRQLVRIGLDRFRPDARVAIPFPPFDFDLAPEGRSCAVSFGEQGAVGMFPLSGGRPTWLTSAGKAVSKVRFRADGRNLLAGNAGERSLSILDAATGRIVVHLPLAVRPDQFCVKADGGQLFITGVGMDAVVVVYPYSTEVAATVLAGRRPGSMAVSISPDREYLFVANPQSGDLSIVSIDSQRVIAIVTVGDEPCYVTVTPDDQYALILNRRSGNMAVVRIPGIVATRTRSASLFTVIPVGAGPVSAAVQRS